MMESSHIIRLNIEHYRGMLKLNSLTEELRPQVIQLLTEAQAQLPLAEAEEFERERQVAFSAA
jgi:hypothetical protein